MKALRFPFLVCSLIFLSLHIILAQETSYSIGTTEFPVSCNEYCTFLNTKGLTINSNFLNFLKTGDKHWLSSFHDGKPIDPDFFDTIFMDPNSTGFCISRNIVDGISHMPDHCTGIVLVGPGCHNYTYQYSVVEGKGNTIIMSVTSQCAQQSFNLWRQNPTLQELADYINHKIQLTFTNQNDFSDNKDYFSSLRNRYPSNQAIFDQADSIAISFCNGDIRYQPKEVNDEHGPVLEIGLDHVVSVRHQGYYERPSSIARSWCF